MNTKEAEQVLTNFNGFRRAWGMDNPATKDIGEAIDIAIAILKTINRVERVELRQSEPKIDTSTLNEKPQKEYYGG